MLITQHYTPEIGAAATRWGDYTSLLKENFNVTVLTSVPNYPKQKVFEGYNNKFQIDFEDGITVIRVPTVPRKSNSKSRVINYLFFVLSSIFFFYKINKPNYILVTSPPLTVGIIGIFYKLIYNVPMFLDVRDLWPETAIDLGELQSSFAQKISFKLKAAIYSISDKFITPIPSFVNDFPSNKPTFPLINGISDTFISTVEHYKAEYSSDVIKSKSLRILYAGNHGLLQGLEHILYTAKELEIYDNDIQFTFIGDGSNKKQLEELSKKLNLKNTILINSIDKEDLIKEMLTNHIGIVSLIKTPLFERALPSKTFEYAGAGLMILSTVPGDLATLINQHGMGITIEPEKRTDLKNTLVELNQNRKLIRDYQQKAYSASRSHFKKSSLAKELSAFLST